MPMRKAKPSTKDNEFDMEITSTLKLGDFEACFNSENGNDVFELDCPGGIIEVGVDSIDNMITMLQAVKEYAKKGG